MDERPKPVVTDEMRQAVTDYFHDLFSDVCPRCKQPITKRYQQGRCVYAEPCQHRLYVGRLSKKGNNL